jgi:hypothetical protein
LIQFKLKLKAFSGEKHAHLRTLRVNVLTGAVEVYDPLFQCWTTDHAISEADKASARIVAARFIEVDRIDRGA